MSKLAEQIRAKCEESGCLMTMVAESVIAEMLEPVREAMIAHIVGDCGDTTGLRDAIAKMFEEE